ncbi:MAG: RibD family protein [Hyphomonadaceae bacterium]
MSAVPGDGRPQVTLKVATSLDGRIALANGKSKWITGEEARAEVHRLRAGHDAVLTGSGTVLADDPELTARTDPPSERQPMRILADGRGRVPGFARLFRSADLGQVSVATLETTDIDAHDWPTHRNVHYWMLPPGEDGHLSLPFLMAACAGSGVGSILLECGGRLAASFVQAGLVDRIEWFRAPIILGGDGKPCLEALGLESLDAAPTFTRVAVREAGRDLWESYERA